MKKRRRLSWLLVTALLIGMLLQLPVSAAENSGILVASGSESNVLTSAEEPSPEGMLTARRCLADENYADSGEAARQVRDAMVNRTEEINIYISYTGAEDVIGDLVRAIFYGAFGEDIAMAPNQGDYLRWCWRNMKWNVYRNDAGKYRIQYMTVYYTTAAQEEWLLNMVDGALDDLNLWDRSPYYKYLGIYKYVADQINYDYSLTTGPAAFSAYGALANHKAVCQGYSGLFYLMCKTMGLPVRMIPSTEEANHAWNLIKLGDFWYNADATWDGEGDVTATLWFGTGNVTFLYNARHVRDEAYRTQEFLTAYPVPDTDYVRTAADEEAVLPFRDVPAGSWYEEAAWYTYKNGLIKGNGKAYLFDPDSGMTRAMLVTLLWRMAGSPAASGSDFLDVPAYAWHYGAVGWAAENKISEGTGDGMFSPDLTLTREQLAVFLYRYALNISNITINKALLPGLLDFEDYGDVSNYAQEAVRWAVGAGIITGIRSESGGQLLMPGGTATRAQTAVMLTRFAKLL